MKAINFKTIISSLAIATMISGCSQKTGNQTFDDNQRAIIGTTLGAIAVIVLGNNVGKGKNAAIGAVLGGIIGGVAGNVIGNKMDKQAKEIQDT